MVQEGIIMKWSSEYIPDDAVLYRRVPDFLISKRDPDIIYDNYFYLRRNINENYLSVDWAKYRSAEETKNSFFEPKRCAVVKLTAGDIRAIKLPLGENEFLSVVHDPQPKENNRGHTKIVGQSKLKLRKDIKLIRGKLSKIASWAIRFDASYKKVGLVQKPFNGIMPSKIQLYFKKIEEIIKENQYNPLNARNIQIYCKNILKRAAQLNIPLFDRDSKSKLSYIIALDPNKQAKSIQTQVWV